MLYATIAEEERECCTERIPRMENVYADKTEAAKFRNMIVGGVVRQLDCHAKHTYVLLWNTVSRKLSTGLQDMLL